MGPIHRLLVAALLGLGGAPALPHGGGLNAEGCHTNRKTGDYHCHRAPSLDRGSPERRQSTPADGASPRHAVPQRTTGPRDDPTCYTGPRGGRYTITPSGRKNYSGC